MRRGVPCKKLAVRVTMEDAEKIHALCDFHGITVQLLLEQHLFKTIRTWEKFQALLKRSSDETD